MARVPWKRGSCYLVQVYYCHLGTGYYVISLFGFSKKARNSDFYVSSPKFFQGWLKLMLFCDFTRQYGIFFFRRHWHPFYLDWLIWWEQEVHILGCKYWRGKRLGERVSRGDIPLRAKIINIGVLFFTKKYISHQTEFLGCQKHVW